MRKIVGSTGSNATASRWHVHGAAQRVLWTSMSNQSLKRHSPCETSEVVWEPRPTKAGLRGRPPHLNRGAAFEISQELGQRFVEALLDFFRNYR